MTSDRRFNQPVNKLDRKSIGGSKAEYPRLNSCVLILLSKSMHGDSKTSTLSLYIHDNM